MEMMYVDNTVEKNFSIVLPSSCHVTISGKKAMIIIVA